MASSGKGRQSGGATLVCCLLWVAWFLFPVVRALGDTLPIISTPPQSVTVNAGSNVVLTVVASGATSYQWRFNGSDIAGATSSSLTIQEAQVTNSGYYVVVAKNNLGWVPALPAYLAVVDTPGLVRFSNQFYTNEIVTYFDGAQHDKPVTNGSVQLIAGPTLEQMQLIPGITLQIQDGFFGAPTLAVPTVVPGQRVYCRVQVILRNGPFVVGIFVSTVETLTAGGGVYPVQMPTNLHYPHWPEWPNFDPWFESAPSSPTNQLRVSGETFNLTNTVFGYNDYGTPVCQWRKDGNKIGSPFNFIGFETNIFLTFSNVQPSDAGIYDLEYLGNNWVIGPKTVLSVQVTNGQGILQNPRLAGTYVAFDLLCAPRRKYAIQQSSNLLTWSNIATVTNSLENSTYSAEVTNNSAGAAAVFYRSRLLP